MTIRDARPEDAESIAALWHDSWHEAHAPLVPDALVRLRTRDNFLDRVRMHLPDIRIIELSGQPAGFHLLHGDEVDQFYVAAQSRGTGAAALLMADAEGSLLGKGVRKAWLACAIGNMRAARFYEKSGWKRAGTILFEAETSEGAFPMEVWRYEKRLVGR